jgi:hypothetical protein
MKNKKKRRLIPIWLQNRNGRYCKNELRSGKTVDLGGLPGRIGDAAFEMLEEHELVERVVPLHQEDPARQGSAEILENNNKQLLNICMTHSKIYMILSDCLFLPF